MIDLIFGDPVVEPDGSIATQLGGCGSELVVLGDVQQSKTGVIAEPVVDIACQRAFELFDVELH